MHGKPRSETDGPQTLNDYINWLVVVLAFALPVYRKWVSIVVPLIFLLWFLEGRLGRKMKTIRQSPIAVAVLVFIAYNLLSLLWCSEPVEGILYIGKYRYLLLVPVVATAMQAKFRRWAFAGLAVGMSCSVVLLVLNALGRLPGVRAPRENPVVTMSHLDYSIFLAVALLLAVNHLILGTGNRRRRLVWLFFAAFMAIGLFVNIGRSGQLAFFVTLLVVVPFYLGRTRWRVVAASLVAILLLGSVYLAAPIFRHRLDEAVVEIDLALSGTDYSTNQGKRIAGTIVANRLIKQHPVLGTGAVDNMREFRALLDGEFSHLRDHVAWFPHLHNQYLQTTTEVGIVGLILLLNIFVQLFRTLPSNPEEKVASVILACVYLVGFLGDPFFHKQMTVALFGCVVGLLYAPSLSLRWHSEQA